MMMQTGDSDALSNVGKAIAVLVAIMFVLIWLANSLG
jgi:hypothetical protein